MADGTDLQVRDKMHASVAQNFYHNLEIAQKCFRCLLELLENGGGEKIRKPSSPAAANETDFEKIVDLCISNARLIGNVYDLLLDGNAGEQPANIEGPPPKIEIESCADLPNPLIDTADNEELNKKFRESIVDVMILAVQCWEQCTKRNKIELAEASNIWRISIDGGRLRVRSMDRYLGVHKLPKVPRWRDVLKTAYFVLDAVNGEPPLKKKLEASLDHMLWLMRKRSLR